MINLVIRNTIRTVVILKLNGGDFQCPLVDGINNVVVGVCGITFRRSGATTTPATYGMFSRPTTLYCLVSNTTRFPSVFASVSGLKLGLTCCSLSGAGPEWAMNSKCVCGSKAWKSK